MTLDLWPMREYFGGRITISHPARRRQNGITNQTGRRRAVPSPSEQARRKEWGSRWGKIMRDEAAKLKGKWTQ